MLNLFLHKSKGSITVMVTLMLVPTIFFTGFLADLARIKCYSNQAAMAADNYGEGVIAEYDNLLKELYGLFAVTQNDEGLEAVKNLQDYMKTSFDPTGKKMSWDHLSDKIDLFKDYDGFMPYKSADVTLSYEPIEESLLSNDAIMSTQIGDFMKFRIVQEFIDADGQDFILDALDTVSSTEDNTKVVEKKADFDEEVSNVLQKMQEYYDIIKQIDAYKVYIENVNKEYETAKNKFDEIRSSDEMSLYREHENSSTKQAIEDARNHENNLAEDEELSDDEKSLLDLDDRYNSNGEARSDKLSERFDKARDDYQNAGAYKTAKEEFAKYRELANDLTSKATEVENELSTLEEKKNALSQTLDERTNVTSELKKGVEEDIEYIEQYYDDKYQFTQVAEYVSGFSSAVEGYSDDLDSQIESLNNVRDAYLDADNDNPSATTYYDEIDKSNFLKDSGYTDLYNNKLVKMFGSADGSKEAEAKKQKEAGEAATEKLNNMTDEDKPSARDLPDGGEYLGAVGSTSSDTTEKTGVMGMIERASNGYSSNEYSTSDVSSDINQLLLKFYVVAYDFGMFSTRTTNVSASSSGTSSTSTDTDTETDTDKSEESDGKIKVDISKDKDTTESDGTVESSVLRSSSSDPAVSLTGIEMSKSVNYLYQSEIEYLFGGSKTSSDNLDMARNYILSFRTVVNMVSTYTISPINDAISSIRDALIEFPVLAVGVEVALRLGITALETYNDWDELKKGNSVVLIKTEMKDLTAYDEIAELLGEDLTSSIEGESTSTSTSRKLSLNYNQYLMVLITFLRSSSVVTSRTADLVMLNVNAVKNKVGDSGTLSASDLKFSMKKAYTAVKATCSVQIDMVVMPKNFAKRMVSSSTYNEMGTVEKNSYSYTVTRGY